MTDVKKLGQDGKRVLQWYMSFTNIGGLSQFHATNLKVTFPGILLSSYAMKCYIFRFTRFYGSYF